MNTSAIIHPKLNKLESKFIKFLFDNETGLSTEIDVKDFMLANFKKPDSLSPETKNETDLAVIFLKNLKRKHYVNFDDEALAHVNVWLAPINGVHHKRWFDSLHESLYVSRNSYLDSDNTSFIKPVTSEKISQRLRRYTGVTWFIQRLKILSMKNIVEMIIAGLIAGLLVAFFIWYFKFNAVRT